VNEQLEELGTKLRELGAKVDAFATQWEDQLREERERYGLLIVFTSAGDSGSWPFGYD